MPRRVEGSAQQRKCAAFFREGLRSSTNLYYVVEGAEGTD